ncbi:NAD-dependent DNA ligase LigA [Candidatus Liberibacter asiaticus]
MKKRQLIPIEALSIEQARKELSSLEQEISYHDDCYYQYSKPIILDSEYDALKRRCDAIAHAFPDLARSEDPNGPLNKIGGEMNLSLFKVTHSIPTLSLEKIWNIEDLRKFITRIYRFWQKKDDNSIFFTLEPKIDGTMITIRYEKGKFVYAALRGDGHSGEDVSACIRAIPTIPRVLSLNIPEIIEVRGEVYISKNDFLALNDEMIAVGRKPYANPRNAASGILRRLNPTDITRYLNFFVHGLGKTSEIFAKGQYEMLQKMRCLGFPVNNGVRQANTFHGIVSYYNEMKSIRSTLPYDIDGLVYKVDEFSLQKQLGERARSPRWMISHKFAEKQASTRLLDIDIQIGRTGILTPVARLEPVNIGGALITNATLHNEDYIKGLDASGKVMRGGRDIRVGDRVLVKRAGEVIPKVVDIIVNERHPDAQPFSFPSFCPICQSRVVRDLNPKTGKLVAAHRCTGGLACSAQQLERLKHFVSRDAFNIEGLGKQQLDFFFKSEDPAFSIRIPADIFTLQRRQQTSTTKIENILGFGDVSVTNLYDSINKRRNISLERFIFSLGIRHVGAEIARSLAKYYLSYQNFAQEINNIIAHNNDDWLSLIRVPLVGDIIAQAIVEFYQNPRNICAVEALLKEVSPSIGRHEKNVSSEIENKKLVFTGTLQKIQRHKSQEYVTQLGAVVSAILSRKTDIIIVGDNPGSKLEKAQQLGVKIMNEEQFLFLLQQYNTTLRIHDDD